MKDKVTAVVTSFNRFDLLIQTVDSLRANFNGEIIIIEDSADKKMEEMVRERYHRETLVFNETNLGLIKSIDKAYAMVKTPFVFHSEDDYLFHTPGFIENSLAVLESDYNIMQVWIRGLDRIGTCNHPVSEETYLAGDVPYKFVGMARDWWGFCFQCGLRSMEAYHKIAPYDDLICEWTENGKVYGGWHICNREKACDAAYHKLGYKVAILTTGYAKHLGYGRSTYGLMNR